jgi:hypothetical protein
MEIEQHMFPQNTSGGCTDKEIFFTQSEIFLEEHLFHLLSLQDSSITDQTANKTTN